MSRLIGLTIRSCLILQALFIAACGAPSETNVERGNREKILFVANGDEPIALDPLLVKGGAESNIVSALFEGLTRFDGKTLEPLPAVAERWEVSEDKRVYTFFLRESARWSNGQKITAHDFVYSWRRGLTKSFPSDWAYMKFFIENAESFYRGDIKDFSKVGVKAISDTTLEVTLNYPTPFFLQLVAHYSYHPLPEATIAEFGDIDDAFTPWTRVENIVSNGPFVLSSWEIYKRLRVDKNKFYWDAENVKLNGIEFLPIDNQQAEVRAFDSGQVHLTYTPTMAIEKIAKYREDDPEVLRQVATYSSYYYMFNHNKYPFTDVRVRKALAMSIDRTLLVEGVSKGGQRPAYTFVPPDPHGYTPTAHFSFDPSRAKQLLVEAGFPNGKNFPEFSILYNSQDDHRNVALAIQQMWKKYLNIDVRLINQEWKVFLSNRKQGNYDVSRAGWLADYLDPSNFFEVLLSDAGNNHSGWSNDDYDRVVRSLQKEGSNKQRYALFEEANKILAQDMPVIPIYYYADTNLVSESVINWDSNVMHFHPFNHVDLR